jgi:hypothetical protein
MDRRCFLLSATAVLAAPAITQAESSRVIKFVLDADVVIFDPVVSTSW